MRTYIPPEEMTADQLKEEIRKSFDRWDQIASEGCSDPFWSDGMNLNLVRNHIIYWRSFLQERETAQVQMSLFGMEGSSGTERPLPPEMPPDYMAPNGKYADRFKAKAVRTNFEQET